ncbi:MAG: phosphoglucomutase/phosphomannomutase family protein, partial [Pedosphaera parvula]|nr:phosphoglucomutase/phosphomannomutase family protein [Pedosphaera parvula]
ESGGIGFPGHIPERDGILAGLMLLELLAAERQPLNKLLDRLDREFGPHQYARIDTHFPLEKRAALMEWCAQHPPARLGRSRIKEVKAFDGVKFIAEDDSWLMLRGSGTEPILRIYAEAKDLESARRHLNLGLNLTKQVA